MIELRCKECGRILPPDSQFCEGCGSKVVHADSEQMVRADTAGDTAIDRTRVPVGRRKLRPAAVVTLAAAAVLIIAALVFGCSALKDKSELDKEKPQPEKNAEATPDEPLAVLPALEAPEQSADSGITLNDISGEWKGTAICTGIEGIKGNEDFFAEKGVDEKKLEAILSVTGQRAAMEMDIDESGGWEFEIDVMSGLSMSARDLLSKDERASEPDKYNINITQGAFNVDARHSEDEGETQLTLNGSCRENSIAGRLKLSMAFVGGKALTLSFDYELTDREPPEGAAFAAITAGADSAAELPDSGASADLRQSDVSLYDICGNWSGTAVCTALKGADGNEEFFAGKDIDKKQLSQIRSYIGQHQDMKMLIDEYGDWEFDIDMMAGLEISADELLSDEQKRASPEQYHIFPDNGAFRIEASHCESEGETTLAMDGVCKDGVISGTISVGMAFTEGYTLTTDFDYELTDRMPLEDTPYDIAESDIGEKKTQSDAEMPVSGDFSWFLKREDNWVFGILSVGAERIEKPSELAGKWKGLQTICDYDGTILGHGYFDMDITVNEPDITAVINWRRMEWENGSSEDISDWSAETMYGSFNDTLSLGVPGNGIELICYELDGRQCCEGLWTVQSGEEVRVALTR